MVSSTFLGLRARRLRLLDLALAKHSFSTPAYFLRAYSGASFSVQTGGAAMVAAFLVRHSHQLDRDGARDILGAALAAYAARAFRGPTHLGARPDSGLGEPSGRG